MPHHEEEGREIEDKDHAMETRRNNQHEKKRQFYLGR
jgi:hypothetical protein